MTSLCSYSIRGLIAGAFVGFTSAQQITLPSPTPIPGFGTEAVIVSDVDGLGHLDLAVSTIDPATGTGEVRVMSTENGAVLALLSVGSDFGRALANVGNVDGVPGDDIAVSMPTAGTGGLLFILSGTTLNGFNVFPVPAGFGATLATLPNLDNSGGAELALGSPQTNQVLVMDILTGGVLYTFGDVRGGGFGSSLASSGNRLAVGAPNFSNTVPPTAQIGYVDVFKLSATAAALGATFAAPGPGTSDQRLGQSLAAIGDLNGDGQAEFAVHAPGGFGFPAFVHVFSEITPAAPMSSFNYGNAAANAPGQGRTASLGDIDGDGRSDFATSDGASLFLFATPSNAVLMQLATVPPTANGNNSGCVVSGPDVFKQGVTDLVTGQVLGSGLGQVRVEPVAVLRNLPNPPGLTIAAGGRPFLGTSPYPITVRTTDPNPVFAVLIADLAPARNTPFGNGTAFFGSSAVTIGSSGVVSGTPVIFNGINLPVSASFLYNGLVFQAVAITSLNTFLVSNGLLARLGTL